jgi:hypothetical protein
LYRELEIAVISLKSPPPDQDLHCSLFNQKFFYECNSEMNSADPDLDIHWYRSYICDQMRFYEKMGKTS